MAGAIGFDIGNDNLVVAAAKCGGVDVLFNHEAKRETPGVMSFADKQRFLGSTAISNSLSTISQVKRLIGRLYKEPSVHQDLKLLPFATSEGPRGGILIELEYMKEKMMFTPVEILGMLFEHLKQIAEKNLQSAVVDCVIGIPSYFTHLQRCEYLDAATTAGLKPLTLMHDGTAIALGYGMFKTDMDDESIVVVFVDIGHSDTQVTIAEFYQGGMQILAHSFDPNLGGRDFDQVLFKHFAAQFKKERNIDVYSNPRACIRLRESCEKLRKVLSANTEAPLSIECLIEDKVVRGIITREEFENLSQQLLERVTIPCRKAIEDSLISVDEIYTIELVGSGSRIPAITKKLTSFFKMEPERTLNASECVAKGCALRCAMLSPNLQVRDYEIHDVFPYSVAVRKVEEDETKPRKERPLCPKGSPFPMEQSYILNTCTRTVGFEVFYTNKTDFPAGMSPEVGHFMIALPQSDGAEKVRAEFVLQLNEDGIVKLKSASLLEPIEKRYKDDNARANKNLLTFIQECRSVVELMSAGLKQKVNNYCDGAEKWLNDFVEQECFKNIDPEHWSKQIKNVMENIHSYVEQATMRFKPPSSKLDIPVDSKKRKHSLDMDQSNHPMDSKRRDDPVDMDKNYGSMDSKKRKHSVDMYQRNYSVDSKQRDHPVDSDRSKKPMMRNSWRGKHTYFRNRPSGLTERIQPLGSGRRHLPFPPSKCSDPWSQLFNRASRGSVVKGSGNDFSRNCYSIEGGLPSS